MPRITVRKLPVVLVTCAALVATVRLAVLRARQTARCTACQHNLRLILLAMHNYESVYGSLPVGIETNSDGTLRRSWRTHLYPTYMESTQKFYNPNFAWDSPENARLYDGTPVVAIDKGGGNPRSVVLDPCPQWVWGCPADSTTRVNYCVVAGDETAFPLDRAVKLDEITDGLENTIVAVETLSGGSIWTEPRDIRFERKKLGVGQSATDELSSMHPGGVNVAFADGNVYFMQHTIDIDDLRALFTIAGGESITREELLQRGTLRRRIR